MNNAKTPESQGEIRQPQYIMGQKDKYMIELFMFRAEKGLNVIEAYKVGDTSLSQTVAHLTKRYGLTFLKRKEVVRNRFGGETSFTRYWLDKKQIDYARKNIFLSICCEKVAE